MTRFLNKLLLLAVLFISCVPFVGRTRQTPQLTVIYPSTQTNNDTTVDESKYLRPVVVWEATDAILYEVVYLTYPAKIEFGRKFTSETMDTIRAFPCVVQIRGYYRDGKFSKWSEVKVD